MINNTINNNMLLLLLLFLRPLAQSRRLKIKQLWLDMALIIIIIIIIN